MAFLAYHASTSPKEYEAMEPFETARLARYVRMLVQNDREERILLARFAAGAKIVSREEAR